MAKNVVVKATPRDSVGKGPARRLRRAGMIPAAVYGEGKPAVAVSVGTREIASILRSESGHNTIFKLELPDDRGGEANVIIKDWQVHPVRGQLLHADLLRLSMTEVTHVRVPIELQGEPAGVKTQGGLLEIELREVEVECLPGDIPDHMKVNVSGLHVGEHVTVADLIYDRDKVKVLTDSHQIVAGVLAPRLVEAPVAPAVAEPEAPVEPETEEE